MSFRVKKGIGVTPMKKGNMESFCGGHFRLITKNFVIFFQNRAVIVRVFGARVSVSVTG